MTTTIPANLARVPTVLASQLALDSLVRTNRDVLEMQIKLASGRAVNRPSDDAVAAGVISVLDATIEEREQRLRNLTHAEGVLNNVDAALGDVNELLLEAKGIGSSQIGIGSDAETRANQALIIDSLLDELTTIANREYQDIFLFGGAAIGAPPIEGLAGGLRYIGEGDGLTSDLGLAQTFPITVSAEQAFGALSTRVQGANDLDPALTPDTRLLDLDGARGLGVATGSVNVDVGGTLLEVDLTSAHTVQDVIDTLQTAIQTVDAGATVSIDASGGALRITPTAAPITVSDLGADATAADLGLNATFPIGGAAGSDLNPRITDLTPLSALDLTLPLGSIRLDNGFATRDVDLSTVTNVLELKNAVEGVGLGVRVEIADTGDRLDFVNELSGADLSIGEVAGGDTATQLGVRSLDTGATLELFNDGLGVQIRSGSVDPLTGTPDPSRDLDFRVTLKDGRTFDVDLAGAVTVQDVLDDINAAAAAAGVLPADFDAGLLTDGNGIALNDNTVGTDTTVSALNGSFAAADLGLLGTTTSATLAGEDRATVAVDSVFTHLIALRDALTANDERGIELATQKLDGDIGRAAQTRGEVGVRARRIEDAVIRQEDLRVQDMAIRSEFQDLDFTEAAIRFSTLQQQLQAGLLTASRVASQSLLDFLS